MSKVRIAAATPKGVKKPYKIPEKELLEHTKTSIEEFKDIIGQAKANGCIAVAFPEDTLSLGEWIAGHPDRTEDILKKTAESLCKTACNAAERHSIYVIFSTDVFEAGGVYNTAFLIGRDGKEIGRYQKVHLPISELEKEPGKDYPVLQTQELGGVGTSICYDMAFPETARCLALNGAGTVFQLTMGGAAFGKGDIGFQAYRVRAADNQFYLIIAMKRNCAIIAPSGKVLARGKAGTGPLLKADIDPFSGRTTGDAFGRYTDFRARLFRERRPSTYNILTELNAPALAKFKDEPLPSRQEAIRISVGVRTHGEDDFVRAEKILAEGNKKEAARLFKDLRRLYPRTWIDFACQKCLANCGDE